MFWKILIAISIAAPLIAFSIWFTQGTNIYSKDREAKVTEVKDPLFGTINKTTEWVPAYKLGLLPGGTAIGDIPNSVAFIAGTSLVVGLLSIRMVKKSRKK